MLNEFLVFRSFYTEEEAISLLEFFKEKGIDCSIVKYRSIVDKIYAGINYDREFHVKIKSYEFNKANEILDRQINQNISEIGEDYYLYSFTEKELLEIIENPDEWNNQDILISKKILPKQEILKKMLSKSKLANY